METMPSFPLTSLAYPRTGKRGVPQQFPRRLFEMLESEAQLAAMSPDHREIIAWSESGRAFGILDAPLFASHILPKYFRTNKFSSFQRNLNLYGFSKVRRGPDADMYYHPSFTRGHPEMLAQLRKCKNRRQVSAGGSDASSGKPATEQVEDHVVYPVSPSPPSSPSGAGFSCQVSADDDMAPSLWTAYNNKNSPRQQLTPRPIMDKKANNTLTDLLPTDPKTSVSGRNKLSLLALALMSVEASQPSA